MFSVCGGRRSRHSSLVSVSMLPADCPLILLLRGVGIMIHSRGANGGTAELVISQIIQG